MCEDYSNQEIEGMHHCVSHYGDKNELLYLHIHSDS